MKFQLAFVSQCRSFVNVCPVWIFKCFLFFFFLTIWEKVKNLTRVFLFFSFHFRSTDFIVYLWIFLMELNWTLIKLHPSAMRMHFNVFFFFSSRTNFYRIDFHLNSKSQININRFEAFVVSVDTFNYSSNNLSGVTQKWQLNNLSSMYFEENVFDVGPRLIIRGVLSTGDIDQDRVFVFFSVNFQIFYVTIWIVIEWNKCFALKW